jgi:hypothetical protein
MMTGVSRPGESPVLTVACRLYRSLFLFCILVLVLYGLGNFQEFRDESQILLLRVVRVSALAGSLLGVWCLGFRAWLLARRRSKRGWPLLGDGLVFVVNLTLLAGVELLLAWLQIPGA